MAMYYKNQYQCNILYFLNLKKKNVLMISIGNPWGFYFFPILSLPSSFLLSLHPSFRSLSFIICFLLLRKFFWQSNPWLWGHTVQQANGYRAVTVCWSLWRIKKHSQSWGRMTTEWPLGRGSISVGLQSTPAMTASPTNLSRERLSLLHI